MVATQISIDIPPDILNGLENGELTRFGTVVRNGTQIVGHLKETITPQKSDQGIARRLADGLSENKTLLVVGIGIVAVGGLALWLADKKKRQLTPEVADLVTNYHSSLGAYLHAIQRGELKTSHIDDLIMALDALEASAADGGIAIDRSSDQSQVLLGLVSDYTQRLAEANSFDLQGLEALPPGSARDAIADLRRLLAQQRRIISDAA